MTSTRQCLLRAGLSRRLRWADALIAAGSIIEIGTLVWNQTVSFFLVLGPGAFFLGGGMLLYLRPTLTRCE